MATCTECGKTFQPKRKTQEFCSTACRKEFNNRRAVRGAIMYDAVMAWRQDRSKTNPARDHHGELLNDGASMGELQKIVTDLARAFQAEDERDREGRRSYASIKRWVDANPWIKTLSSTYQVVVGRMKKSV